MRKSMMLAVFALVFLSNFVIADIIVIPSNGSSPPPVNRTSPSPIFQQDQNSMLVLGIGAVVLLAVAGAIAWYFLKKGAKS